MAFGMTFRFPKSTLLAAILVALAALSGPAAAQSDRTGAQKSKAAPKLPMIFYFAKGEDDACGQGCSEWIAAEGHIEADTAQRLRTFLTRVGKRKLPIFFHSPGGNGTTSTVMGRLLREREMTTGVYETIPAGCVGASEQDCRALKQSGQVLPSVLRSIGGCNSACVFALIGGKVRQVPPGARLGVHAPKVVVLRTNGHSSKQVASFKKTKLVELNAQFRRYVQEMKIDVRLFDLLAKVPHEDIHYLSRDEIVRFGIDTRESNEARWMATELVPQQLWTMKFFIEGKGDDRKELRTSVIRLECGGASRTKVSYFRSLGSHETEAGKRTIKLTAGRHSASLSVSGSAFKIDAIENGTSYNLWHAYASYELFEAAAAGEAVEIVEQDPAKATPRITKLSTAGLSQAIAAMRRKVSTRLRLPSGIFAISASLSAMVLP